MQSGLSVFRHTPWAAIFTKAGRFESHKTYRGLGTFPFFKIPAQKHLFDLLLIAGIWDLSSYSTWDKHKGKPDIAWDLKPGVCLYHRQCATARGVSYSLLRAVPPVHPGLFLLFLYLQIQPRLQIWVRAVEDGREERKCCSSYPSNMKSSNNWLPSKVRSKRGTNRKCRCWLK